MRKLPKNKRLVFNLNGHWFDEIWSGRKTCEYREIKPHWDSRLRKYLAGNEGLVAYFQTGYETPERYVLADVTGVTIGTCPYDGWDGNYYVTSFTNVRRFRRNADGSFSEVTDWQFSGSK